MVYTGTITVLMKNLLANLRFIFAILVLWCATSFRATAQLTSQHADGRTPTAYINPKQTYDTIFAFNQTPAVKKGDLFLRYCPPSTINWELQKPNETGFKPYKSFVNVIQCGIDTLMAGTYRITVTNKYAPDSVIMCRVDTVKNEGTYNITVTPDKGEPNSCISPNPQCYFNVSVNPVKSTFDWYRFNKDTKNFPDQAFATIPDAIATQTDTLSESGYMVKVTPQGQTAPCDSFVAWLYMNPGFNLKLKKDDAGAVYFTDKFCDRTDFRIDPNNPVQQSFYVYYNPTTGGKETLNNVISFTSRAGSGAATSAILRTQGSQQYFRIYQPPYQDIRYYFTGKDMFGIQRSDDIQYETIIPHAAMTLVLPEIDPQSAPVAVSFLNQSINVTEYLWRFGDGDSAVYNLDHLVPDTVKHSYYTPKTYTAVLFVSNLYQCTDSIAKKITVDPPKLDVANVFTPNGDNMNDYFKPENVSIRSFEISIFTRAGMRVYHYKGNDLRSWQGWDGRINGGKDAAEGVYFYVLKATGWDEPPTKYDAKNGNYRGAVYLYR